MGGAVYVEAPVGGAVDLEAQAYRLRPLASSLLPPAAVAVETPRALRRHNAGKEAVPALGTAPCPLGRRPLFARTFSCSPRSADDWRRVPDVAGAGDT